MVFEWFTKKSSIPLFRRPRGQSKGGDVHLVCDQSPEPSTITMLPKVLMLHTTRKGWCNILPPYTVWHTHPAVIGKQLSVQQFMDCRDASPHNVEEVV